MMLAPPGLLSTTICCPRSCPMRSATRRATMSGVPPAADETRTRTGRDGQLWAPAPAATTIMTTRRRGAIRMFTRALRRFKYRRSIAEVSPESCSESGWNAGTAVRSRQRIETAGRGSTEPVGGRFESTKRKKVQLERAQPRIGEIGPHHFRQDLFGSVRGKEPAQRNRAAPQRAHRVCDTALRDRKS